jgi:Domain of unknown function (DUF4062)
MTGRVDEPKRVYLSSTFEDLKEHRRRVYEALNRLGAFQVVAMEDYVATDLRPVDRCLADVASADLYIGLFAFRYGHVPDADNAARRSITEMEYRHAGERGIPRLIFMAPDETQWNTRFMDGQTGAGDGGDRIRALRQELRADKQLSEFTSPDQLAEVVAIAAARWLRSEGAGLGAAGTARTPASPHPRQLRTDLLLLHTHADKAEAEALAGRLRAVHTVEADATGLLAGSADELTRLDRLLTSARSVAVLLSGPTTTVLAEDAPRSRRTLRMARDRTGALFAIGLATDVIPEDGWGLTTVLRPTTGRDPIDDLAEQLHIALLDRSAADRAPEVGLPLVVVAMTAHEAAALVADPPAMLGPLLELAGGPDAVVNRYGETRSQWRPFWPSGESIRQVIDSAVDVANQDMSRTQGRRIRLQPYPLDALQSDLLKMWAVYEDVARIGGLVVADELSMFHTPVREAFVRSPLHQRQQVALVTLSPLDLGLHSPYASMRAQLAEFLTDAARRFEKVLDPLCELNVPERRRLVRWLHGSLPLTIDAVRDARQNPAALNDFADEIGRRRDPSAMPRTVTGGLGFP